MVRHLSLLGLGGFDNGESRNLNFHFVLFIDADDAGGDTCPVPLPTPLTLWQGGWGYQAVAVRRFWDCGWVGKVILSPAGLVCVIHAILG